MSKRWLSVIAGTFVFACTRAPIAGEVTPLSRRLSDADIARDYGTFRSLDQRVGRASASAVGARAYVATRAQEYLRLAREAYERNDESSFVADLVALAKRDVEVLERGGDGATQLLSSAVLFPDRVRLVSDDAWSKAMTLRTEAGQLTSAGEIARAEATLLRAGHPVLRGPACVDDAAAVQRALDQLTAAERSKRPAVESPSPMVVPPRPAPVPMTDSVLPARLPREERCASPERLAGVPSAVHFALDRAELAVATRTVLDRAIDQLRAFPGVRVRLSGHTDFRASNAYNQALSQRRVDAVIAYLESHGIARDRLVAGAFGEERLKADGTTLRDHARNRRVDITYTLCDGSELTPTETIDDLQFERRSVREK